MQIELISKKRILSASAGSLEIIHKGRTLLTGTHLSLTKYMITYRADGHLLYQICYLDKDLPDEILLQHCERWAQKRFANPQPPTANS